jgi:hypothetical protein
MNSKNIFLGCVLCFASLYAHTSDSLQLVSERLFQALHSNPNGCYEISMSFKPLTERDTTYRTGIVKVYPTPALSPQDSIRNHYFRCGFEPFGRLYHDGVMLWYSTEDKQMFVHDWDRNRSLRFIDSQGWYLYPPLLMNYNAVVLKQNENTRYHIADDSLFYYGERSLPEDSAYWIHQIEIRYQPSLRITIIREYRHADILMCQYKRYDIHEVDADTIAHVPKQLTSDYLSVMPGYSWKPIVEQTKQEPLVKQHSAALPWKGLLLNGDTLRHDEVKERFVVLDFWYKACGPCWESIRELSKYNDNLPDDVRLFAVNPYDWRVKEDALSIFRRQGGNYEVVYDTDRMMMKDYAVRGFPSIYVIDTQKNEIILLQVGHATDLIEKISESIKKAKGD